jgi:sulfur-carrier protein
MNLQIRLFAAARDIAGCDRIEVHVPDPATVVDLRAAISQQYPKLDASIRHSLLAINHQYAHDATTIIPPNADIACIPPVSGG